MLSLEDIIARIKQRIDERQTTARAVSIEATGAPDFLKDIFNGKNKKPSAMALVQVARALGSTSSWLLEGRDEVDAETPTVPIEFYIGAGAVVVAFEDQWS